MRFTSITFGLTALLASFVAAAPTSNAIAARMPTPEEFDSLSPVEARDVYRAWYRATNIIPVTDDV
jgi:hypothetical protein